MNQLLQEHGIHNCLRVFGSTNEEMPREETKIWPDSFILDYIHTLNLGPSLNREREGKIVPPPAENRSTKKRVLIVYGTGDSNARDTPLIDNDGENPPILPSQVRIDIMKGDNETSKSTDTISQLIQDLAFLRKDFHDSIQSNNLKKMKRMYHS